jgi:hypothetical protein
MLIANPIYDVVFKYLMEDTEIARRLLSKITGEDIIDIAFHPQEYTGRSDKFEIIILRLDFKATIRTKNGKRKKVLIELQKGKNSGDIMRFRRYLGDNYKKEDTISEKGESLRFALPIITIYFLGFRLNNVATSIMKVNREYVDLITEKKIEAREEFIEKLTHDSFVIQIPRLKKKVRTALERVLKVFNQSFITDDKKTLEFDEKDLEGDELLQLIANRLRRAATEEDILRKIEIEEEVESTIEKHIREKQELAETNVELKGENVELKGENVELKGELSEKDKIIEKLRKQLEKKTEKE